MRILLTSFHEMSQDIVKYLSKAKRDLNIPRIRKLWNIRKCFPPSVKKVDRSLLPDPADLIINE